MKIAGDLIEVKQSVTGESVVMGIRQEHMGKVMGLLAGAYSNKVRAIIREYSTNAWDAHVETGTTDKPIEVKLPSGMMPAFSVKDYGTGLSVEDIHNVYAMYGYSTKDQSNDFTGALGIGCKAALAYCSAFTVESVKDGTKIIVSVAREASGAGTMTVVDTVSTDEPNGTLVTVPVARGDVPRFASEAADFFKVWPEGSVLVNGHAPTRFDGLKLSDSLYIVQTTAPQVVMGNVAYPAPQLAGLVPSGSLLAFVPLGAVGFPPSREALDDTRTTKDTLARIKDDYAREIVGAIQREIDKAKTPQEAVKLLIKWSKYVPNGTTQTYTYKGHALPTHFERPKATGVRTHGDGSKHKFEYTPDLMVTDNRYGRLGHTMPSESWQINNWPTTLWVYNYTPAKFNAQHKKKIRKWCADQGIRTTSGYDYTTSTRYEVEVTHFVLFPEGKPSSPFIDPARCADWDVIRKIQLEPRATTANGVARIPGSYDLYTEEGYKSGVPGDDIRQACPLFYHRGNRYSASVYADALAVSYPKFTLVCLAANRIEKFKRILPSATSASVGAQDSLKLWLSKLTTDQRLALHMRDASTKGTLMALDPSRLTDKDLRDAARVARINVEKEAEQRSAFRYVGVGNLADVTAVKGWVNPLGKYPLFNPRALTTHPDHVYAYINAGLPA